MVVATCRALQMVGPVALEMSSTHHRTTAVWILSMRELVHPLIADQFSQCFSSANS